MSLAGGGSENYLVELAMMVGHIVALRLLVLLKNKGSEEAPPELSCTELPQQWRRPRLGGIRPLSVLMWTGDALVKAVCLCPYRFGSLMRVPGGNKSYGNSTPYRSLEKYPGGRGKSPLRRRPACCQGALR
ncbi:hypothetical protein HPB47_006634 [Ixodes persulcatus]|uniref:Uncharacterized protein n=1 Tax=Ixodes persulcatus TaxID=34615 RepID=A0AC60QZ64_IXOPE|nr:hypothetical protein HPB47_006634 [Ixodes persulcatus]